MTYHFYVAYWLDEMSLIPSTCHSVSLRDALHITSLGPLKKVETYLFLEGCNINTFDNLKSVVGSIKLVNKSSIPNTFYFPKLYSVGAIYAPQARYLHLPELIRLETTIMCAANTEIRTFKRFGINDIIRHSRNV